jgi:hypothetical protein
LKYENVADKIRVSWMRTARAQIPEFHATKMLFEYCCHVHFILVYQRRYQKILLSLKTHGL